MTLKTNSQTLIAARETILMVPWVFCGAVILSLVSCYFGFAPLPFLLASAGMAGIWFALLIVSWRWRSEVLRVLSLLMMIFGQQVVFQCLGDGSHFAIKQGILVILVVFSALILLLRRWIYKFARLEDPGAQDAGDRPPPVNAPNSSAKAR